MKLNYECIRALLLYFEENLKVNSHGLSEGIKVKNIDLNKEFPSFPNEEIYYSIRKLVEANYIIARNPKMSPRKMIIDEISLEGHEFIDASRNNSNWKKAIEVVKKHGGGITLDILKRILIQLVEEMFLKR